jgi:hypothetical protein
VITFRRSGGMPPGSDEWLQIDADGRFRMRRVDAVGAIGSFAGALDEETHRRVMAEADECAGAPGPGEPGPGGAPGPGGPPPAVVPDSVTERVDVDAHSESLGSYDEPTGACAPLVTDLRALLDALIEHPVAALALEVAPPRAVLRHRGRTALRLEAEPIEVTTVHWDVDGSVLAQEQARVPAAAQDVAPGWELTVVDDLPAPTPGQWLQVDLILAVTVEGARHAGVLHHMQEA